MCDAVQLRELLSPKRWARADVKALIAKLVESYTEQEMLQWTQKEGAIQKILQKLGYDELQVLDIQTALEKMWQERAQEEARNAFLRGLDIPTKIEDLRQSLKQLNDVQDGKEVDIPLPCFIQPQSRFTQQAASASAEDQPDDTGRLRKLLYRSCFEKLKRAIARYYRQTHGKPFYVHGPKGTSVTFLSAQLTAWRSLMGVDRAGRHREITRVVVGGSQAVEGALARVQQTARAVHSAVDNRCREAAKRVVPELPRRPTRHLNFDGSTRYLLRYRRTAEAVVRR